MGIIDDLISTATPRTNTVRVFARGDLVNQYTDLMVQLNEQVPEDEHGTLAEPARSTDLADQMDALKAKMEASAVEFTVRSVSQHTWANLLIQYPASPEQRRAGHDCDLDGFQPAAIAACVTEPEKMTLDQAKRLKEALPSGEWTKIWLAVYGINCTETPVPKWSAASAIRQANGQSATSSEGGSLAQPSSDGGGEQSPDTTTRTDG